MVKNRIWKFSLIVIGLILMLTSNCKKDDNDINDNSNNNDTTLQMPTITTSAVRDITVSTAICGGSITSNGGATITSRGVCWSTGNTPTISDNKTNDGTAIGSFTSNITGLAENTTYYICAYASNSEGTAYGNILSFNTNSAVAPCNPDTNSIVFNLEHQTFYSVSANDIEVVYGNYAVSGIGSSSDLRVEFAEEPTTGLYITISPSIFIESNECIVSGVFGGILSYNYSASPNDTVYVIKNGNGKYSVTFCDLHFSSGSTDYTFNSDGNLTSE